MIFSIKCQVFLNPSSGTLNLLQKSKFLEVEEVDLSDVLLENMTVPWPFQLILSNVRLYHFELLALELEMYIFEVPFFCCILPALEKEGLLLWDSQHVNLGLKSLPMNRVNMGLSQEVKLKNKNFIWNGNKSYQEFHDIPNSTGVKPVKQIANMMKKSSVWRSCFFARLFSVFDAIGIQNDL